MLGQINQDYAIRPARLDDVEAVCELCNAWSMKMQGMPSHDVNEERVDWQTPGFDLETDARVVITAAGEIIAYASAWDTSEPHVRVGSFLRIHPDHDDPDLEKALLVWLETRAAQAIERAPADARVYLSQGALAQDTRRQEILTQRGFELVRHFVRLRIEMSDPPEQPTLPEGIRIRPFEPDRDLPAMVEACREAFRDHWGYVEEDYEEELKMWSHWVHEDPDFDPSVWHLACEGDEIVGLSLGTTKRPEADNVAYIHVLCVRKEWRGRGIARALLQYSFAEYFRRERPIVDLDADATNLTGAMRLYEGVGMHVIRTDNAYEKELRPGRDLACRGLEERDPESGVGEIQPAMA